MRKERLGDHRISVQLFDDVDELIQKIPPSSDAINRALLELIQAEKEPCFLLAAVLDFVRRVDEAKLLPSYTLNSFELWLNQHSGLNFEENLAVRSKIVGKKIERADYQLLFPVGMGKVYEGSHFVTAHKSPDLDTTISSFWGWVDAFGARVSEGLHIWNLPGGPPGSQIEIEWLFKDLFGEAVLTHLPQMREALHLQAQDLMMQKGLEKRKARTLIADIEHDLEHLAVIVVDDKGAFLGDWRSTDVEGVRQVIIALGSVLRWFENALHLHLISVFAKKTLHLKDVEKELHALLAMKISSSEPVLELSPKQQAQVETFMQKVLSMKKGFHSTFEELAETLSELGEVPFGGVKGLTSKMKKAGLFDSKGHLFDERPRIFTFLEEAIRSLHLGVVKIRSRMEQLDIALETKYRVFGRVPTVISQRAELQEMLSKIGHYSYLTVVSSDGHAEGVVRAETLRKPILGTVSLRDFCNRDEMGIPAYLDVISVIDHHKSAIQTGAPPVAILSDVQSTNTLVAEQAFQINDANRPHIHPEREFIEYLHFLYGIIDDTDLLSKVSAQDVHCVASLLNRMKSLASSKNVTVIDLQDLPRGPSFPRKAAQRILRNEEMYSLYCKVYQFREKEVEKNLLRCTKGKDLALFADTKEQNGCCRIGQTKLFAKNFPLFKKHAPKLRQVWLQQAKKVHKERSELDLHMHMINTIVSADEVYRGKEKSYKHQDELWIWIPETELAREHLKSFLIAFQSSPGCKHIQVETGSPEDLSLFKEVFPYPCKNTKSNLIILRYPAGALNSRKSLISPYLPR